MNLNNYYNNLCSIEENPNKNKYSFSEKLKTSLSCFCFFIAIFLPSGEYLNIYIFFLIITSFLHHFSDQYFKYNSYEYQFFERLDWGGIILLLTNCMQINYYICLLLSFIILFVKRYIKDIIVISLYISLIITIHYKDTYLSIYTLFISLISILIFHTNMRINGWNFFNSWGWHLCCLQLMVAMKLFFI